MKKVIYLNAGHSLSDSGAVALGNESIINRGIRDALILELRKQGFEVYSVPDNLNLVESISWVNNLVTGINDGLAFSIHQNCCGGEGAESYYFANNQRSKTIAHNLINAFYQETGFKNRGAKSDTQARYGRLGWIRNTDCWATLIECGFIDNVYDYQKMKDPQKIAKGIAKGICAIYGILYNEGNQGPVENNGALKEIIGVLKKYKLV